ncbi:MAG TPA: flagellar hook-basal body complex protein, partial [Thermodesulfovibrionales bacterium]|nr:flagellar hook-basal body complex protein [Thermodesulfovibrionales bacterium]
MITSLYTAISGLSASGTELSVIGDNIANMNTIGFKGSRVEFGDVLSQTLAGVAGSSQVGRGVLVSGVSPLFTQGSFETTESALDMAIDGEGLFIVNDGTGNYYTRAGQFSIDKNGNVVNPDG